MLTILGIVLWNLYAPRILKPIPSVLVGVSLATVATVSLNLDIAQVKVRDDLLSIVQLPSLQSLSHLLDPVIIGEALALALIASVDCSPLPRWINSTRAPARGITRNSSHKEWAMRSADFWAPYP